MKKQSIFRKLTSISLATIPTVAGGGISIK